MGHCGGGLIYREGGKFFLQSRKVKWQKMFSTTGVSANQDQMYMRDAMRTQEFPPTPEQQCAGRASRDYTQKWNSASRRECQGHPIQRPKGMICRALTGDRANVYRLESHHRKPWLNRNSTSSTFAEVRQPVFTLQQGPVIHGGHHHPLQYLRLDSGNHSLCGIHPPPPLLAAKRYHTI